MKVCGTITAMGVALCAMTCLAGAETNAVAVYTLDDCIRIGLRTSGAAALARFDQAIAGTLVGQARSQVMPQVSMNGSYTRIDEVDEVNFGIVRFATASENNTSAGMDVTQVIYPAGGTRSSIRAARYSKQAADWLRADAEQRIVRDIRSAFYDVLAARAALEVREESVLQVGLVMRQTRSRYRRGSASEFDKLRAEVDFANESRELIKARNQCEMAMVGLGRMLNLDGEKFDLDGKLAADQAELDVDDLLRSAGARPSVQAMSATVRAIEKDFAAARLGRFPSLVAVMNYDWGNRFSIETLENEYEWHWAAGVAAEWSFWDGGRTAHLVRQKALELEKAKVELAELVKLARMEVQLAVLEMRNAEDTLEGREDEVKLAEKALEIANKSYDAGAASYLEFMDANLALSSARLAHVQALREHAGAMAGLKYACGREELRSRRSERGEQNVRPSEEAE